jgi:serine/threonine protein kinase
LSDDTDIRARERVGTSLNDKWTLERLLGIGGMAAVYAARHRNGARAAIKVLHQGLSRHAEVRERFLREGYAANRVEHSGAVKVMDDDVVDDGPDAGTAFIVMELLEGESLQDRLERSPPLTEREFLGVAEGVLDVLQAAHGRGVVHRDLKPENLFLVRTETPEEGPKVKVLDFGLARLLDGQSITSHGLALGTPSFMAPEQAAGRIDEIDGRTDLFALGATGFRVRTGRRIHEGQNAVELVGKMANFAAPPIRNMAPEVSAPYARVVDKALEFKREDRYADAAAMREDVRRAIAELDGEARTLFAIDVPPSQKPPSVRPPPPLPSAPSPSSSFVVPEAPPSKETTLELSGGDLERSLPVVTPAPRRRKRLSLMPWITLLVFAAIGAKLWLDHRGATPPAAPAPSAEALIAVPSISTPTPPAPVASVPEAIASETPEEPATAAPEVAMAPVPPAAPAVRVAPAPAAVATHPRAPGKVGPGNVHKLPGKHRNKSPR